MKTVRRLKANFSSVLFSLYVLIELSRAEENFRSVLTVCASFGILIASKT